MSAKVNLTELLADREAGTGGEWWQNGGDVVSYNPDHWPSPVEVIANCQTATAARRIARLPDLEAAYIEAVEVVRALLHGVHGDGYVLPAGAIATARARKFLGEDQ